MLALIKLIPLRDWAYIAGTVAIMLGAVGFVYHERSVGAETCQLAVTKAQIEADKRTSALQAKLDHEAASHDAALRAAITAVPRVTAPIRFDPGCQFSAAQVSAIREALK